MNRYSVQLLVATAAVAVTMVVPQSVYASSHAPSVVSAQTYHDVDSVGTNMNSSDADNTAVSFENVILTSTATQIKGMVSDKNTSTPFSLSGSLAKAENDKEIIVGHLSDDLGNFDVIHFSLDRTGSKSLMFNRSVTKGKGDTVLKLYLLQKNTRNLTVVELLNPSFLSADGLFLQRESLQSAERSDQFWYTKILKPISTNVLDAPMSDVNIASYMPYYVTKSYAISYNLMGDTITETFNVKHYVSAPGSIASDGASFYIKMNVESEYTDSYYDGRISNDTSTKIGAYQATTLDTYCATGDAMNSISWDGAYSTKGSLDVGFRWSKSYLSTNLGFTISYTGGTQVGPNSFYVLDNSGTTKVRQVGYTWAKGKYLQNVGEHFDSIINVGNYDPSLKSSYKTFGTRWTYDISNGQNYTWGGQQQVNVASTYGN